MTQVGRIADPRCEDALDLLEERRLPDGGWPAEKRYYTVSPKAMVTNADYVKPDSNGRFHSHVTVRPGDTARITIDDAWGDTTAAQATVSA